MLSEFNSQEAENSAFEEAMKTANSWEGKLNELSNTWTDFINGIVDSDTAKGVIDFLNSIIKGIDSIRDGIGTIPVILGSIATVGAFKNVGVFSSDIRNGFIQYGQTLKSLKLFTGDLNTQTELLALTVQNLTPRQQALALATNGVNQAQIAEVLSLNQVEKSQAQQILLDTAIIQKKKELTMATAQEAIMAQGLNEATALSIMQSAGIIAGDDAEVISKKQVSVATLEAKLAQEGLSATQIKAITTQLGLGASTVTLSNYFKGLAASALAAAKAVTTFLLTNPIGWAILAGTAIIGVTAGISNYNKKQEELRQKSLESAKATQELTDSMDDLISQYEGIVDSEKSESEKTKELTEWKQTLAETYGITKDKLANLNLEREEGIELLKEEIRLAKIRQQDDWRDKNEDVVAKSRQRLDRVSRFNSNGYSYMDGTDVWTQQSSSIANDIKALFDRIERTNGGLDIQLKIDTDNAIEELERLQSISNEITNISFTRTLTSSEQQLLDDIKSQIAYLETFQSDIDVVKQDISANAFIKFETYKTNDESYKNLGKESYISWRDGLLKTANGDKLLEKELLSLAEQQFPDYAKYFENLNKAKIQFGVTKPNSGFDVLKKNFLESLSDEDLEVAIQIPDLFIDGIENATEKIENFKKVNNFDKSIKSLEELKEAYDGISDSADKFISNQKTLNSAFEEQEKYGRLASSTVSSLIEAGYSRALSVDAETGAITLNKDAVEMLNNVKKQELKLSIMREKLSLQEKLRDESIEINSLTAEMAHATEERREEIRTLIAERMAQASLNDEAVELIEQYDAILAMIDNPIEFDSDSNKSTKDEEPAQVTAFKKELAEKQHLVAMKKLSEEEYLNWLDGAYKEAYAGLTGYEDELYKYEEEIFSKRKELAEKAFDETIDGIEKEIEALEKLKAGNERYLASETCSGDISSRLRLYTAAHGQAPYAIIVSCSDSRVIPESIFSAGLGELFVIRVAGNVIDDHQLGSIEYAASHLGTPLIVVLGHTLCGAVDAAINSDPEGYIRFITDEIKAAIGVETDDYRACCLNVRHSMDIIEHSLQIHSMEESEGLRVIGAVYHIDSGKVDFL